MTAANVTFTKHGEPCDPDQAHRFGFTCPKRGDSCRGLLIADRPHGIPRDGQNLNGGRAQWDYKGNETFSPSINCGRCGWHGYIRNGRCVDTNGKDEP